MEQRRDLLVDSAFVVVMLAGAASADLFRTADGVSVWYPPAAFALAYIVGRGWRRGLLLVLVVRILGTILFATSVPPVWWILVSSITVAGAYTVAGRWLSSTLRHRVAHPVSLPGAAALIGAGLSGAMTAALLSRVLAGVTGRMPWDRLVPATVDFFVGDAVAILTLTPVLLVVLDRSRARSRPVAADTTVERPGIAFWVLAAVTVGVCRSRRRHGVPTASR